MNTDLPLASRRIRRYTGASFNRRIAPITRWQHHPRRQNVKDRVTVTFPAVREVE
ncbi:hypothetical protein [Desulfosarcina ovata]|uniref:hypothetical protein n=1 Tax=Desulfosarcina ovata TaxID=83564 RepID=UPI0012D2C538|nr:hypothetical protein [Desulfosarcina ovata]